MRHHTHTGWWRLIGSSKLQIIFHRRATKYRSLLREMTHKDKGAYESSPPCNMRHHTHNMRHHTHNMRVTLQMTWESHDIRAQHDLRHHTHYMRHHTHDLRHHTHNMRHHTHNMRVTLHMTWESYDFRAQHDLRHHTHDMRVTSQTHWSWWAVILGPGIFLLEKVCLCVNVFEKQT